MSDIILLTIYGVLSGYDTWEAVNDFYHPSMLQDFAEGDTYSSQEKGHGREETRCALVTNELSFLGDLELEWPNLKSVGIMVNMRKTEERATEQDMSVRFYISSKILSAKELHDATRSHWGIESMYWQLDVTSREDACRIRVDDRVEAFTDQAGMFELFKARNEL